MENIHPVATRGALPATTKIKHFGFDAIPINFSNQTPQLLW